MLFISFWVWSNKNPEGIVAQKILKGLEETVEEVNVITSQKFEGYNFLKDTYIFNNYSNKFQNIFNKILSKLIGCSNIFFIIKALKYISENKEKMNYDIVISRSEPIATHIITLYLRWKRKDKNTKYIFSFSDPGYLNPYLGKNNILKKFFYYLIERKIIKTNEIITFTNQYLADLYIKKYEIVAKNIFILFNPIIKKEIINTNSEYKSEEKSKIKFCYTGTLTKERNLKLLLEYFIFLKNRI